MADCLIQGRGRSRVGESVLEARRLRQLGIREYIPVCVRARESMQVEPQSKTWGTPMVVIDLRAPVQVANPYSVAKPRIWTLSNGWQCC